MCVCVCVCVLLLTPCILKPLSRLERYLLNGDTAQTTGVFTDERNEPAMDQITDPDAGDRPLRSSSAKRVSPGRGK